jgi:Pyridoxamine 5'-phosphate oxidase
VPDQPTDHAGLETLPFHVCLRLLASVPIGRVGFYADGEMVLLPVNHAMDGQDVVFRTASGSKLTAAQEQELVAFEADDYDLQTRSGWSILVTGRPLSCTTKPRSCGSTGSTCTPGPTAWSTPSGSGSTPAR